MTSWTATRAPPFIVVPVSWAIDSQKVLHGQLPRQLKPVTLLLYHWVIHWRQGLRHFLSQVDKRAQNEDLCQGHDVKDKHSCKGLYPSNVDKKHQPHRQVRMKYIHDKVTLAKTKAVNEDGVLDKDTTVRGRSIIEEDLEGMRGKGRRLYSPPSLPLCCRPWLPRKGRRPPPYPW